MIFDIILIYLCGSVVMYAIFLLKPCPQKSLLKMQKDWKQQFNQEKTLQEIQVILIQTALVCSWLSVILFIIETVRKRLNKLMIQKESY